MRKGLRHAVCFAPQKHEYLVAKVPDMSFRPKGEIFSSVIKDFSVTSFLRNDTVINATKYRARERIETLFSAGSRQCHCFLFRPAGIVLEPNGRNSEQRVVAINVTYTQSEDTITTE
jgi:hypothetical protein